MCGPSLPKAEYKIEHRSQWENHHHLHLDLRKRYSVSSLLRGKEKQLSLRFVKSNQLEQAFQTGGPIEGLLQPLT